MVIRINKQVDKEVYCDVMANKQTLFPFRTISN